MIGITSSIAVVADWNDNHMGGDGWMWLWGSLMMLFMIAVVGLIVWLAARGPHQQQQSGTANARAILADRMARGEIAPEEYRERLQHLQ